CTSPPCFSLTYPLPLSFFFFTHPPTPQSHPLPLHAALPISPGPIPRGRAGRPPRPPRGGQAIPRPRLACRPPFGGIRPNTCGTRSEEHTSELQSLTNLVCRLLLEKKKQNHTQCPFVDRVHTT